MCWIVRHPRKPATARPSQCSSTARSSWPATPAYVESLCEAIESAGGRPLPLYCASLRTPAPELLETLTTADAMVVTVLAAGGAVPATVGAGGDDDSWNVAHLAALDVPILQGLCLTSSRAQWDEQR